MRRPEIIEKIKHALMKVAPNATAILYGSEARGEAHADSDIDLLILEDGDTLSVADEIKITAPLYDIELETGVLISARVLLRRVWENRPFQTPFTLNVQHDGIVIQ